MSVVATNIIALWPSTNASIPAGWSRETSLDTKYIQGAAAGADADLASSFGATTHTHTSPSHTPTQNAHTHEIVSSGSTGNARIGSTGVMYGSPIHTHPGVTGDSGIGFTSTATTATNQGVAITVSANTSNDLGYVKVIFIKSDGSPTGVPSNGYGFFASDTLPASWTRVQGNKYLKGADAAGDGGATGGSNTHTHLDNGGAGHTHPQNSHTHSALTSPIEDIGIANKQSTGTLGAKATHTHSVSCAAATATNQAVVTTISTDNHEPVYKKLNIINNGTGGQDLPDQLILLWGGANGSIPTNWARFTSMDGYFLKGANADGESNSTTGGATTHTHTASNCQPTQNQHTHTFTGTNANTIGGSDGLYTVSGATHTHEWTEDTVGKKTTIATNNAVAVTIDNNTSKDAYPPYVKIIFIKYTTPVAPTGTAKQWSLSPQTIRFGKENSNRFIRL